jgi:hypothetical protein
MTDYKNMRYEEPEPLLLKIVYGLSVSSLLLACVVGACL